MTTKFVTGKPSTMGDSYQLNTTTIIRHSARTFPEQEIIFRTATGGWDRYTYADSYARTQRIANALESLGVSPGDVVGILDWNSKRHFELYWAIPGTGAVMLQMNLRLPPGDLGYVTAHSGASVILVDETLLPVAEGLAAHSPGVTDWVIMSDRPMSEIETTLPNARHFEDLVAAANPDYDWPVVDEMSAYSACYTTGTTGRPKGIFYSHRSIYLHTLTAAASLDIGADDTVMPVTPMFHCQSWGFPQAAVYSAAKIVLPGRYQAEDLPALVDKLIEEEVTVANGAPAIFQPMLDYVKTLDPKPDLSRARLVSGSTEPSLSLMREFYELTGANVIHAYGATETTPFVAVNLGLKPSLRGTMTDEEMWDRKRSQGLIVNGIDVRVIDAEGNTLPHDGESVGEILLRGPWIAERYFDLDDDGDHFLDGHWRSGDVGSVDADGYLKLTDRLKDVIKSGGEWISSIDMENAIVGIPRVADAAVISIPHPRWEERPLALVVTTDGTPLTLEELHAGLAERFAAWQLPEHIVHVDTLPRTGVGKIDKKALRLEHAGTSTSTE
ncbi:long-chain-fatty-acid--CoA ligase [Leucobacter sp. BZR 635]